MTSKKPLAATITMLLGTGLLACSLSQPAFASSKADETEQKNTTQTSKQQKDKVQQQGKLFWSSPTGHFPKGVFILNG